METWIPMKAYRVTLATWDPPVVVIRSAETPGQAKAAVLREAHEAGYETIRFVDFRVRRAPEFDGLAQERPGSALGGAYGLDRWGCLLPSLVTVHTGKLYGRQHRAKLWVKRHGYELLGCHGVSSIVWPGDSGG